MNRFFTGVLKAMILPLLLLGLSMPAAGQAPIKVTFNLNTSTNPDTLGPGGFAQIRGALNGKEGAVLPGGKTINWGSGSELVMQNSGGDYWTITIEMNPDDTLRYKFWTGFARDKATSLNTGWENDLNATNGFSGNDRAFISGAQDTTVQLQFYNGSGQRKDQLWRPFASKPDSVAIFFRVNMGGVTEAQLFNPGVNGPVGVRGDDQKSGKVLDWGTTKVRLTRETNSVDKGSFWSGVAYFPKAGVNAGDVQNYKFFVENKGGIDWEGGDNRTFRYPGGLNDTTLHWVDFDRRRPTGKPLVSATITFRVSTEALEGLGLFDRGVGDEIKLIGPKGWDVEFGLPDNFIDLNFIPALQEWTVSEPFTMIAGTEINYKYFIRWDTSRVNPRSPNYIPNLFIRGVNDAGIHDGEDSGWEEPGVTGGDNRKYLFTTDPQQFPVGDFGFDRHFFNSVPGNGVFKTPMTITWNVNMAPATNVATNPENPTALFRPGTDTVWVQFDGSLFALSQGFPTFNFRAIELKDPDGDMIYSASYEVDPPGWYQMEFKIAYSTGTPGIYVANGAGVAAGRRYYQFIHPTRINQDLSTEWPATYEFPVVDWTWRNLPFEPPPDLTKPTSVAEKDPGIPFSFALEQNYPNPFNPETTIHYQLARSIQVKIGIYNVMGQLVKTLVDENQNAGKHTVVWRGDNDQGKVVSTGIYFVKMQAGDFTQTHKMTLLR